MNECPHVSFPKKGRDLLRSLDDRGSTLKVSSHSGVLSNPKFCAPVLSERMEKGSYDVAVRL